MARIDATRPDWFLCQGVRAFLCALLVWPVMTCGVLAQDPQAKPSAPPERQDSSQEPVSLPLPKGKKLYLKDGNYQIVGEYEQKSDRVRYYSVERAAWEEIPANLVDWDATRKAEADEAKRIQALGEKVRAEQAAARAADVEVGLSIEIAPGVFLPDNEGLYVVQGRAIAPLEQSSADFKLDKGRLLEQVISPVPIVPSRHRVELAGKRAKFRLSTSQPEFYIRTADAREPELELIRAQVKGDRRLIEHISTQITGQQSAKRDAISIQRWEIAKGVYRITMNQSLLPGEYALSEVLPEGLNLFVWDFGVDSGTPTLPQNPASATPPKPSAAKPGP